MKLITCLVVVKNISSYNIMTVIVVDVSTATAALLSH